MPLSPQEKTEIQQSVLDEIQQAMDTHMKALEAAVTLFNPESTRHKRGSFDNPIIIPHYIKPLVALIARAIEVFGTSEKALRWMNTPVPSLGNRTPLSLLENTEGIASVEDALGRIEHGVW